MFRIILDFCNMNRMSFVWNNCFVFEKIIFINKFFVNDVNFCCIFGVGWGFGGNVYFWFFEFFVNIFRFGFWFWFCFCVNGIYIVIVFWIWLLISWIMRLNWIMIRIYVIYCGNIIGWLFLFFVVFFWFFLVISIVNFWNKWMCWWVKSVIWW